MVTGQSPRLGFDVGSSSNVYSKFLRLSISLVVVSIFFWMYLFSQTFPVTHTPTDTIQTVMRASGSRERERGFSAVSVEGRVDAANKRAMDVESAKQNQMQRELIMNQSASIILTFEHLVDQTPAKYLPPQEWNHSPDIWILGCAKSGTSQLYQILTHHQELQAFHPRKEFCMDPSRLLNYSKPNDELYSSLYFFHEFMNSNISKPISNRKKLTVNGCLHSRENFLHYMYMQKYFHNASSYLAQKKFIIIVRDPADLLYSNFNFFSIPSLDLIGNRPVVSWSYELLDYRTPELFHELLVSGNKSLCGKRMLASLLACFVLFPTWMHLVGHENVLVLKNEDMFPEVIDNRGGLLDQLSTFLGIDRNSFDSETLKSRTNCNDGNMISRGMDAKCINDGNERKHTASSLSYPISNNRAMLSETRELVYIIASEACHLLEEYFNHVVYDGCM